MFFNPIHTEERVWETDNLFIERMTEDPFRVDTILFELLIDIFASGYGRTAVERIRREVFGEVSDQSLDVIRGMKGCVRHYTGVVNIAFRSTLTPEEVELGLSEHLHDSYEYEFNNLESPKDRETVLARRFSTHYWQCAARQAATSRRICKLVFGLPDAIVEMLVNASTVQIEMFAAYHPQRFALIYPDAFFKRISTVRDDANRMTAADSPIVTLLKSAYAMQTAACFKGNPLSISTTASHEVWDVFRCSPERIHEPLTPEQAWAQREREMSLEQSEAEMNYNRNRARIKRPAAKKRKVLCADLQSKQALVPLLYLRGLTNNQVASFFGMTEAQVRSVTGTLRTMNDGRGHKRRKESAVDHMFDEEDRSKNSRESLTKKMQSNFFISLYCTLCEETGLTTVDLKAFFTAEAILKKLTVRTRLAFNVTGIDTAELWDTILKVIQGLYLAQRCPVCSFVSFTRRDSGEFEDAPETDLFPCPVGLAFANDTSLAAFAEYMKSHLSYVPDDEGALIERWADRHPESESGSVDETSAD